jgi:lactate racemase
MNSIELPYTPGKTISLKIPKNINGIVFEPRHVQPKGQPEELIYQALRSPLGCKRIEESVDPSDNILIVCDDITRPTPTKKILPILLEVLNRAGISDRQIEILFALGTHRPMTDEEMQNKVGNNIFKRLACHNHNAFDKNELENYGNSREGIPVWLNRRLKKANYVIGIGDIVPHPIAGFSGGAKILYPGVAGEETIEGFHVSFGLDPQNHYGSFSAPSRESIHELAAVAGLDFLINTIIDEDAQIVDIFAGNYLDVYMQGMKVAQQVYGVPTKRLYDIVIASSYPAWLEFWQGGKGIYAAVTLANPDAEIILASACPEGIAQTHPDFGPSIGTDPSVVVKGLKQGTFEDPIGAAIAVKLGRIRSLYNISLISQGLTREDTNQMGFHWHHDIHAALNDALRRKGYPKEIGIIPYGGHTYCYVE